MTLKYPSQILCKAGYFDALAQTGIRKYPSLQRNRATRPHPVGGARSMMRSRSIAR